MCIRVLVAFVADRKSSVIICLQKVLKTTKELQSLFNN